MSRYTRFPPKAQSSKEPLPASRSRAGDLTENGPSRAAPQGRDAASAPSARHPVVANDRLSPMVWIFLASLLIPILFSVGSLKLAPVRIVLLIAVVPVLIAWISGKCGRIRLADIWLLLLAFWMFVTFNLDGGHSTFRYSMLTVIEVIAPYLLARTYIRSQAQYEALLRILFWIAVILLPAAAIESFTKIRIYNMIVDPIFSTFPWANYEPRLGLYRAQTVFEHPILYGVMVAFFTLPVFTLFRQSNGWAASLLRTSPILLATFLSLSAGAWMGAILQALLSLYKIILRNVPWRWWLALGGVITLYFVVLFGSNQPVFQFFSGKLAFDSHTAYHRYLIWIYGWENVWQAPLFGRGLADWDRPIWLYSPSIDNLWLVFAIRHGLPGLIFILGAYVTVVCTLIWARPQSETVRAYREALVFALIGLAVALVTVHLWSATFNFIIFMLGAGMWMRDVPQEDGSSSADPATDQRRGAAPNTPITARGGHLRPVNSRTTNNSPRNRS